MVKKNEQWNIYTVDVPIWSQYKGAYLSIYLFILKETESKYI